MEEINILKSKCLYINEYLLKYIDKDMSLIDFLVFMYILNNTGTFDINNIANNLDINLEVAMESFNNLIVKGIVEYSTIKDKNGLINEVVNVDKFYHNIIDKINKKNKQNEENNIYEVFQKELVRSLSPIEYEYINNWLDKGMSEDLIIGALKEAVLSGARNFKYINSILYEWKKKGFVTMNDVEVSKRNRNDGGDKKINTEDDLLDYDYDWLNDDEE